MNYVQVLVALTALIIMLPSIAFSQTCIDARYKLAIVYAPGVHLPSFIEKFNSSNYVAEGSLYSIGLQPPYTSIYYELLLLSPGSWAFTRGIPINSTTIWINGTTLSVRYSDLINQTTALITYSDVALINTNLVLPTTTNYTVNFAAIPSNSTIRPAVFKLNNGSSIFWRELNTTMLFSLNETHYELTLSELNKEVFIERELGAASEVDIYIEENWTLNAGTYWVKFTIFPLEGGDYLIVSTGGMRMGDGFSQSFTGFNRVVLPRVDLSNIDEDIIKRYPQVIKWLFNESIGFYVNLAWYTSIIYGGSTYFFSYPLIDEVKKLFGTIDEGTLSEILGEVYRGLDSLISTALSRLGGGATALLIVSPYSLSLSTMIKEDSLSEAIIAPGVIKFSNKAIDKLISEGARFELIELGGEKLILVKCGWPGVSEGHVLIYPSNASTGSRSVDNPYSLLNALITSGEWSLKTLVNNIAKCRSEVVKLSETTSSLNNTIVNLNNALIALKSKLAQCEIELEEFSKNITAIDRKLLEIEKAKNDLRFYAIYGVVSTAVIALAISLSLLKVYSKARS
ncbi:MAG: hypothetical protein N3E36_00480 [Sulfolobales archaeon]|nr:hypothetical protein [Sulfolobales archaeon]MCX8198499.1 hypothetical protein [Sulfolobales archaeon]MDW8169574.1 hypothetical protein [Desulfurococcaceae archaeon]